jgi:N utilization substance protein A
MFIDALDIDDVIAHLLVTEGFTSLEEVAYVVLEDLADIEGFDADVAAELQERARVSLERRDRDYEQRRCELGVSDDLASLERLTPGMLVALGENQIKTLDDFAGLAGDELVELLDASDKGGVKLELEEANALIMQARAHWYDDGGELATKPGGEYAQRSIAKTPQLFGGTMSRRHQGRAGAASPPTSPATARICYALSLARAASSFRTWPEICPAVVCG